MVKRYINGTDFALMALAGANNLQRNEQRVNALNVFPVPDGDTGTNMNLTMTAGIREMEAKKSASISKTMEALSKGLLMGARGNSGVILSQLFRGMSRSLVGLEDANVLQFAAALQQGVELAYKAVVKPVEGTILTVAKDAARHGVQIARRMPDITEWMHEVCLKAEESLEHTPELLPVLKQVGVVDSGGQGLLFIYEGFLTAMSADERVELVQASYSAAPYAEPAASGSYIDTASVSSYLQPAQAGLSTKEIEFFYDMEFFIDRTLVSGKRVPFDENAFKRALAKDGDSILVIMEDDIVKVHVHSRKPGDVLNVALPYGELTDLHILNMRQQHRDLVGQEPVHSAIAGDYGVAGDDALAVAEVLAGTAVNAAPPQTVHEWAPFGVVAVAQGTGITNIFLDNGADLVLTGEQTMNPSTEDFLNAIKSLPAEHVYLLPNNSNVIMAAEQAAKLSERSVIVIPTSNVPQGLAALLAFKENESPERNTSMMTGAAGLVTSGAVTRSVRDTDIDGVAVKEGEYISLLEKTIVASELTLVEACQALALRMLNNGGDLLTILTGEDATVADTAVLTQWIEESFPDIELEVQEGGQPLYSYLFALE